MGRFLGIAVVVSATALAACAPQRTVAVAGRAPSRAAWFVDGGVLKDPCGEELVIRGVNKMAVFADRNGDAFPEIASTGANAVRFMWVASVPAREAVPMLRRAKELGLLPIWELHDATGDFSKMGDVIRFWTNPDTVDVLRQFEQNVVVNVANEGGDAVDDGEFVATYGAVIAGLRAYGLSVPILIDAAGWGRNIDQLLRVAPTLLDADMQKNTFFSWHVYNPDDDGRIDAAIATAKAQGTGLIIGELGPVTPGACDLSVPYREVLRVSQRERIGWLAWSWDNFNGDCNDGGGSAFDMVGDGIHASTLRPGYALDVVRDHEASIARTSTRTRFQQTGRCGP